MGFVNQRFHKFGFPQYYDENGKSSKRTIMKTPINGARLSSKYGNRKQIFSLVKNNIQCEISIPERLNNIQITNYLINCLKNN